MSLHLVDASDQNVREFCLQEVGKLSEVEFGNDNVFVSGEHLTGVFRQRVDVAEMSHSHFFAGSPQIVDSLMDMTERAAPSQKSSLLSNT